MKIVANDVRCRFPYAETNNRKNSNSKHVKMHNMSFLKSFITVNCTFMFEEDFLCLN